MKPLVSFRWLAAVVVTAAALSLTPLTGCSRTGSPVAAVVSKVNRANFDQIHEGMSKAQVEAILGSPTTTDMQDKVIYKRTIWRYTQGDRYINITFKNDELDGKDTNLGT